MPGAERKEDNTRIDGGYERPGLGLHRCGGVAQQGASIAEAALKKEVNAFMDQYWQLWSAGEIDQQASRIYHPFGQLSNQGHSTVDALKAAFPQTRKAMVAKGYARSQMPMPGRNVCILAPNVAVVSGRRRPLSDRRPRDG